MTNPAHKPLTSDERQRIREALDAVNALVPLPSGADEGHLGLLLRALCDLDALESRLADLQALIALSEYTVLLPDVCRLRGLSYRDVDALREEAIRVTKAAMKGGA